eukprot:1159711-Pelagomonas_calceolata.AAC.3
MCCQSRPRLTCVHAEGMGRCQRRPAQIAPTTGGLHSTPAYPCPRLAAAAAGSSSSCAAAVAAGGGACSRRPPPGRAPA